MPLEIERLVALYDGGRLSRRELGAGYPRARDRAERHPRTRISVAICAALSHPDRQSCDHLRLGRRAFEGLLSASHRFTNSGRGQGVVRIST
jgi:hypothetical protein